MLRWFCVDVRALEDKRDESEDIYNHILFTMNPSPVRVQP